MSSYQWANEFTEELLEYARSNTRDFHDALMQWRIEEPEQWEDFKRILAVPFEIIRQQAQEWEPNLSAYLPSDFTMTKFEEQYGDVGIRRMVDNMKELLFHCVSLSFFRPNSFVVSMTIGEYETGNDDIDGCQIVHRELDEWYEFYTIHGILMTPELSEDITTGRPAETRLTKEYVTQTFADAIREWGGRLNDTRQLRRLTIFTVDPPNRERFDQEIELPPDHPYNQDSEEDDYAYQNALFEYWQERYMRQNGLKVFLRQYYGSDEAFRARPDQEGFIEVTFDEDLID